jgi:tetratricopeptide (TPR) repeat protein
MLKTISRLFRRAPAAQPREKADTAGGARRSPDVDALLAEPLAALQAGRTQDAIGQLETLIESWPEIAEAHAILGDLHFKQRRFKDAQDEYLLAFGLKPDWWKPHYKLGMVALEQQSWKDAEHSLRRALDLGTDDARVHNALGAAYLHQRNVSEAVSAYRQAVAVDPELAQAHSNLGYVLFRDLAEYDEGARHIERALELAPDDAAALCNRIMVLDHIGRTDEALQLAGELLESDPGNAEARLNKALLLLKKGEFGRAWPDYEARKHTVFGRIHSDLPWPEWDGSSLADRTVYVYPEQGIGDQIMFASCMPDVVSHAKGCALECDPRLAAIFRRSFEGAEILTKGAWKSSQRLSLQPPDCKVAMGSLPGIFRHDLSAFPPHKGYLRADPAKIARWKARLAELPGRRTVGISWRGGLASTRQSLRSIALREWLPILSVPDVDFISLQYSDVQHELDALRHAEGTDIKHWPEAIEDYDETAALVAAVDLVVSVQTAVVHLAGALGKRTWALISALPEWRYGAERSAMPWYPTVELIRQERANEWNPVLQKVRKKLLAWSSDARALP